MTAVEVYKVKLGDRFRSLADGVDSTLTVTEFVTPATLAMPWLAKCSVEGSNIIASVKVSDLVNGQFEKVE